MNLPHLALSIVLVAFASTLAPSASGFITMDPLNLSLGKVENMMFKSLLGKVGGSFILFI